MVCVAVKILSIMLGRFPVLLDQTSTRTEDYSHQQCCLFSDHEIISAVILLHQLIQEGLLSLTHESMCTKCWLTIKTCLPRKEHG